MIALRWILALSVACAAQAAAQAHYTATGPGSYIAAGATFSSYESAYGQQRINGATFYVDTNLYRRVGAEAEARLLPLRATQNVRLETFLIGPRISTHGRTLRPYAKLLAGRGEFRFPFNDAHGSYFVVAPGVGLDYRPPAHEDATGDLRPSRFLIRVEVEYQLWPGFTFGALHPYGVSSGVSCRVF